MITEERKARLAAAMNRLGAHHEIQNEMGRIAAAINFHQVDKVLERFALERDDVWLEFADEGVFRGAEAVRAILNELVGTPYARGELTDIELTTPIIVVAEDQDSARALWWVPGIGTIAPDGAEPRAIWTFGQIAADFVRADGAWKVLHFHYFRTVKSSYEEGWVKDTSMVNRPNTAMHPLSSPSSYHSPYTPLSVRDGIPAAPRPYASYDGAAWMLETDKSR